MDLKAVLNSMKSSSTKPAPVQQAGDLTETNNQSTTTQASPKVEVQTPTELAKLQFTANQQQQFIQNVRQMRCALYGATQAGEVDREFKKWLFNEFLDMAKMVEVEE